MGCKACACNAGLSNTGTKCTPIMQVAKKVIIVPIFDDAGARNGILYTAALNQAFFDALVNQADKSKRWFPLPEMKNVEDVRGENINETFEDQSTAFVQEGNRSFKGWLIGSSNGASSPQLKGNIEAARCVDVGVYVIDKAGNLIGKNSADGLSLEPIRIDAQSLSAKLMKTTDTTIQKLELLFNFQADECDEDLRTIIASEQGSASLLDLVGLLLICARYTNIDSDEFLAELFTEYGTPINPVLDKGLVIGDFTLKNVTDDLAVTILTLTEDPDGFYKFTFATQDVGDKLELTPSKTGRDYSCVIENQISIAIT